MEILIIGSGIAGLSCGLRMAEFADVTIITKKGIADSATNLAQGGIAAVLDLEQDSIDSHVEDTLIAGAGLCDYEVVSAVVGAGFNRVQDLISYGVDFVKGANGSGLSLGREGGHSFRRVAHSYDLTGRAIEQTLLERAKENPRISLYEDHLLVDLLTSNTPDGTRCSGAYILDNTDKLTRIRAHRTIVCTGGIGKVYLYTSNPDISTGDGIAAASRAGAELANMEFVQFHPTCLYHPQAKNFLISEAVRGEGAILVNHRGERFMEKYDERLELATRDKVARSIDQEMKESGEDCVYLDISHRDSSFIKDRFPGIYQQCRSFGIDIRSEPIPVVPAAHYLCGGILVDSWGNSSIDGLMAIGEASCTGLHGANRLASNSLLEAVVYAEKAATYCMDNRASIESDWSEGEVQGANGDHKKFVDEHVLISHNWDVLRRTMWNYVGIVRNSRRLDLARERLITIAKEVESIYRQHGLNRNMLELRNLVQISMMIVVSAMNRKESRGLHYSSDFPDSVEEQRYWTVIRKEELSEPWKFHVKQKNFVMREL